MSCAYVNGRIAVRWSGPVRPCSTPDTIGANNIDPMLMDVLSNRCQFFLSSSALDKYSDKADIQP